MKNTIVSVLFLVLVIIIIILGYDNYYQSVECKDVLYYDHETIKKISRLSSQSSTQTDPLHAYDQILEARIYLRTIIEKYRNIENTEKMLKFRNGYIMKLKSEIESRYENLQKYLTNEILKLYPNLQELYQENQYLKDNSDFFNETTNN